MEKINYSQIYNKITKGLSEKTREIFDRRFGIKKPVNVADSKGQIVQIETLESIGQSFKITRERVRQIEEAGFNSIRKNHKEVVDGVFAQLAAYFNKNGGFKNEEIALEELGGKKNKPYVLFFLTMSKDFHRVCEKKENHNFWTLGAGFEKDVKENLRQFVESIDKEKKLLDKNEMVANFASKQNLSPEAVASYLEISKKIQANKEGEIGLIDWPEIKPRGVKDKAFLVFKKHQKPLHFRQITQLIDQLDLNNSDKKTHAQTVHNELIKDSRFVLVGRGTYALAEWGYLPGTIKDVIAKVISQDSKPVTQDEIVKKVLAQRMVARNTVMINLNNKKLFSRDEDGRYSIISS